jgi:hypothetical protein
VLSMLSDSTTTRRRRYGTTYLSASLNCSVIDPHNGMLERHPLVLLREVRRW